MTGPTIPVLERPRVVELYDLQASPSVSWVIDVELPRPMHRDRFMPLFPGPWRLENNVSLHAFCPDSKLWTYPESSGMPERYTRLQLAVALAGIDVERDGEDLTALLDEVRGRLAGAGITEVTTRTTLEEAVARAAVIDELLEDLAEAYAGVMLIAPEGAPFTLGGLRQVAEELGLAEGDLEDGFAWLNAQDAPGDEALFTAVPEIDRAERIHAIRFSLHVARTAEPAAILEQLLVAARHVQDRLGGDRVGLEGEPFDGDQQRAWVERVARRLRDADLEPGAYHTMTVF
jgi:hypothetical protein